MLFGVTMKRKESVETLEMLNKKIDNLDAKLDQKLEKLDTYMHSIDKTLVKQNADLEYHIKRTTQLEDEFMQINERLMPIEDHTKKINIIGKFLIAIFSATIAILGVVEGIKAIIGH